MSKMNVFRKNVFGNPNVGVYVKLSDDLFLYPPNIDPKIVEIANELDENLTTIELTINNAYVIGSYAALNSKGMILPSIINDNELELIKSKVGKDFSITIIDNIEENTFGNLILCNDKGAIISEKLYDCKGIIAEGLHLPEDKVQVLNYAGSYLPGSCGYANNKGCVVHPLITEEDAGIIAETLDVNIDVSTINCGIPFIASGMVANSVGAIFGRESTGPELQRILNILEIE